MHDALAVAIQERLGLLRRGSPAVFEEIQVVTTAWLVESRLPQRTVALKFDLSFEQLIQIARLEPGTSIKGWTRTWARCAAAIAMKHPTVTRTERVDLDQRISADPEGAADAALQFISELARSVTGNREECQTEVVERLTAWASQSRLPRSIAEEVLSDERFSEGLQDGLAEFYGELQYLTIKQLEAVEASFRERRLWINGPAGSGKTIVAIEALYRALRAGLTCVVVYRSSQFERIFRRLLSGHSGGLILLPHLDLMHLLWTIETEGQGSTAARQLFEQYLPGVGAGSSTPLVDLIVIDDCGTFSVDFRHLLQFVETLAHRAIFLAAEDQVCGDIRTDDRPTSDGAEPRSYEVVSVASQRLACPEAYHCVAFTENLRSARSIASYASKYSSAAGTPCIRSKGRHVSETVSWEALDAAIVSHTAELLRQLPPTQIHILVDPYLEPPSELPTEIGDRAARISRVGTRGEIADAIVASAWGSFLNSTLEDSAEEILAELLSKTVASGIRFFYTDPDNAHLATTTSLKTGPRKSVFSPELRRVAKARIDAEEVLDPHLLADPLAADDAILIYPSPLFIGLESDAVIYVRNRLDPFNGDGRVPPELSEEVRRAREQHHYMAVSRARMLLVELAIE